MKLNASEGNEPRKASSPLPFREAINNFVGNLSVTSTNLITRNKKGIIINSFGVGFFSTSGTVEVVGVKRLFAMWVGIALWI
ncbi:MAG: hypothetical protein PHP53_15260 [Prolixibacteraceae bacterium]|nr:hypothetical protein [Prolixibacteraceae bacterium]